MTLLLDTHAFLWWLVTVQCLEREASVVSLVWGEDIAYSPDL